MTSTKPRALVVFDFDESLVEEDCDIYFLKTLCPQLLMEVMANLKMPPGGWCDLIDDVLGQFHARMPEVTREEMLAAAASVPVSPRMLDAIRMAVDEYDATVMIASDANDKFIGAMLEKHGLSKYVSHVFTNRASWNDETTSLLRLKPFHPVDVKPHGCELCPRNMCKGLIIDSLRAKNEYDVVLYVGDGVGDYCPSTRLTSRDTVFARANAPNGKAFGLLKKIEAQPEKVAARVVQWSTGEDIYNNFKSSLQAAKLATEKPSTGGYGYAQISLTVVIVAILVYFMQTLFGDLQVL